MSTKTSASIDAIRDAVREHYAAAARAVSEQAAAADCCGGSGCGCGTAEPTALLKIADYDPRALAGLPEQAVLASLGCGNPTALAALKRGETVLDLGSGGGIDVLLSAKRVGPTGLAYGLDMTDEMLALAERNRAQAGITNVKFLKGHIEAIPLPDASVDVIISNCVINLSGDKDRVLREAFRVLRPGGRFAVSDIVLRGTLPPETRGSLASWSACVAGALTETEYHDKLARAGFNNVGIEATASLGADELICCGEGDASCCGGTDAPTSALPAGTVISAFIRARKP